MSTAEIEEIRQADALRAGKPQAQQILAEHVTRFVHGEEGLAAAQRITQALFSGDVSYLSLSELAQLELDGLPCVAASRSDSLLDLLLSSGLASSKRQARECWRMGRFASMVSEYSKRVCYRALLCLIATMCYNAVRSSLL